MQIITKVQIKWFYANLLKIMKVSRLADKKYRVAQNHGKQVLRISPIKFHFPIIQFVVIPPGQRDLSSLPWIGEAAVQIS